MIIRLIDLETLQGPNSAAEDGKTGVYVHVKTLKSFVRSVLQTSTTL
jgi:hypothetical protein